VRYCTQSVFLENAETVFAASSNTALLVSYMLLAASAEDGTIHYIFLRDLRHRQQLRKLTLILGTINE
jgi:hypothetical protein